MHFRPRSKLVLSLTDSWEYRLHCKNMCGLSCWAAFGRGKISPLDQANTTYSLLPVFMTYSSSDPASAIRFSSGWRQSKASWFGLLAVSDLICLYIGIYFGFMPENRVYCDRFLHIPTVFCVFVPLHEHLICYFKVRCCEIHALSLAVLLLNLKHSYVVVRAHSSWAEFREYFRLQVYYLSNIIFSSSSPYVWCLTWHIFWSLV